MTLPACTSKVEDPSSIASEIFLTLEDHTESTVAILDPASFASVKYKKILGDIDHCELVMHPSDDRVSLFLPDYFLKIYRSVPACDLDWYLDFQGFVRDIYSVEEENGDRYKIIESFGLNDLLARRRIGYKAGTIRADKSCPAETAMKEYVLENCGHMASTSTVVGRLYNGVFPGFSVEASNGAGPNWEGSRPFEDLLDVLKDISRFSDIDFSVEGMGNAQFIFRTYEGQYGENRTQFGLDPNTGLNAFGNSPVVFSVDFGNMQSAEHMQVRSGEKNIVYIIGQDSGSLQEVTAVADTVSMEMSPWNTCEISRPGQGQEYEYQREDLGREVLEEMRAKDNIEFIPLQLASCLYGKHYKHGDKVTAYFDEIDRDVKLIEVESDWSEGFEKLTMEFGEKIK
jgi:hypothetical protein